MPQDWGPVVYSGSATTRTFPVDDTAICAQAHKPHASRTSAHRTADAVVRMQPPPPPPPPRASCTPCAGEHCWHGHSLRFPCKH